MVTDHLMHDGMPMHLCSVVGPDGPEELRFLGCRGACPDTYLVRRSQRDREAIEIAFQIL